MPQRDRPPSGIYVIRNVATGDRYLGKAEDLMRRKRSHFRLLERGRHSNELLQASYRAHGAGAFVFEVVELVDQRKDLGDRERHWCRLLRPSFSSSVNVAGEIIPFTPLQWRRCVDGRRRNRGRPTLRGRSTRRTRR